MKILLFFLASLLLIGFIAAKAPQVEIILAAEASLGAYNVNTQINQKFGDLRLVQFYQNTKGAFCKVFVNSETKTLIVAYRGSASTNDWSNNFNAVPVSVSLDPNSSEKDGKVHEGFWVSYKASRSALFDYLKATLSVNSFKRVIFTGHSQGGAVAMLSIYEFLKTYPEYKNKIEFITFGQPRVGKSDFIRKFNALVKNYTRIVSIFVTELKDSKGNIIEKEVGEDLVTQVPPPFLGFQHSGEKIDIFCGSLSVTKCHDMSTYLSAVVNGDYLD